MDCAPTVNGLISNVDTSSFMDDKLVGTLLGWGLLDIDGRRNDDGTRAVDEHLFLLINKKRACQEDHKEEEATEESSLAQHEFRSKEVYQDEHQGKDCLLYTSPSPRD